MDMSFIKKRLNNKIILILNAIIRNIFKDFIYLKNNYKNYKKTIFVFIIIFIILVPGIFNKLIVTYEEIKDSFFFKNEINQSGNIIKFQDQTIITNAIFDEILHDQIKSNYFKKKEISSIRLKIDYKKINDDINRIINSYETKSGVVNTFEEIKEIENIKHNLKTHEIKKINFKNYFPFFYLNHLNLVNDEFFTINKTILQTQNRLAALIKIYSKIKVNADSVILIKFENSYIKKSNFNYGYLNLVTTSDAIINVPLSNIKEIYNGNSFLLIDLNFLKKNKITHNEIIIKKLIGLLHYSELNGQKAPINMTNNFENFSITVYNLSKIKDKNKVLYNTNNIQFDILNLNNKEQYNLELINFYNFFVKEKNIENEIIFKKFKNESLEFFFTTLGYPFVDKVYEERDKFKYLKNYTICCGNFNFIKTESNKESFRFKNFSYVKNTFIADYYLSLFNVTFDLIFSITTIIFVITYYSFRKIVKKTLIFKKRINFFKPLSYIINLNKKNLEIFNATIFLFLFYVFLSIFFFNNAFILFEGIFLILILLIAELILKNLNLNK
jgi:hypothetical protein